MMNVLVRKLEVGSVGGASTGSMYGYSWLAPYSLCCYTEYMYIITALVIPCDVCIE